MTTRLIGAVIMSHGDDSGLKLPPRVAPTQVVIIPISMGNWKEDVLPAARAIEEGLKKAGLRVLLDMREEFTPGWKFSEHEMRGVPLRIEIGPRDVKAGQAVLVRRDTRQKMTLPLDAIASKVPGILEDIQASLFREAETFLRENIRQAGDYEEFKDVMDNQRGFVKSLWCGSDACEDKIKEDTMATIRVIPLEIKSHAVPGACVCCGKEAKVLAYFARAY
jgi:prolyl-tRNA synthetase